jgi:ATP-dependent DNA ligase
MSALFERRRVQGAIPLDPCLPRRAVTPPTGDDWVHEIKHDGFRIVARRDGGRVRLFTRNGYDFTVRFPKIAVAVAGLPMQSCVIDGEAIVVDRQGLSVFDLLRYRRYDHAAVLCAFDLIEHAPASPTRSGTCAVGRRSMISMKYPRCRRQSRSALAMG